MISTNAQLFIYTNETQFNMAKIIVNKFIPFKGFLAINLFGTIFVREEYKNQLNERVLNHELIHSEQIKELGYILFYILYLAEWLIRVLLTKDAFSQRSYYNLSFEKEAFSNEDNLDYIKTRKQYAWMKYFL